MKIWWKSHTSSIRQLKPPSRLLHSPDALIAHFNTFPTLPFNHRAVLKLPPPLLVYLLYMSADTTHLKSEPPLQKPRLHPGIHPALGQDEVTAQTPKMNVGHFSTLTYWLCLRELAEWNILMTRVMWQRSDMWICDRATIRKWERRIGWNEFNLSTQIKADRSALYSHSYSYYSSYEPACLERSVLLTCVNAPELLRNYSLSLAIPPLTHLLYTVAVFIVCVLDVVINSLVQSKVRQRYPPCFICNGDFIVNV